MMQLSRRKVNGKRKKGIELVVECFLQKWNRRADTAIKQIREKRYTGSLKGYGSEVLLAGITYDRKSKKHKCKIERLSCV